MYPSCLNDLIDSFNKITTSIINTPATTNAVLKDVIGKNKVTSIENKFSGTGTKEDAYQISKVEDLITFFINLNQGESYKDQYFILNTSLDFQDDNSYLNPQDTSFGDLNNDGQIDNIKQELTTGKVFIKVEKNNKKEKDNKEIVFEGNFKRKGKAFFFFWFYFSYCVCFSFFFF